jgi:hypothetical protein
MTMAVAGRTRRSYAYADPFNHSPNGWGDRTEMSRPPLSGGGLDYMKDGSPPWGGLGGYPFTPWERALGARGGTNPSCMRCVYRPRRVKP